MNEFDNYYEIYGRKKNENYITARKSHHQISCQIGLLVPDRS